ncbi:TlpA family protein disulfide reductase [Chloroflexi bacterium CFX3]|nr:TlpA family protein disulfide reductase [Chloroflexi bacterium CFX3]
MQKTMRFGAVLLAVVLAVGGLVTLANAQEDLPAWMTIELVNAETGETFTLADFAGKTILVEPMATWCSNCRRQITETTKLIRQLTEDEDERLENLVFIGLSIETNLQPADLKTYAERNDFALTFAVMSEDMLRALVAEFGRGVANPPSSPSFIIRADGTFTELIFGIEPVEDILAKLEAEYMEVEAAATAEPTAAATPKK